MKDYRIEKRYVIRKAIETQIRFGDTKLYTYLHIIILIIIQNII